MWRQVAGELLGGGAEPQEHHPRSVEELRCPHPNQTLLPRVLERPRVERDVERARDVRRGAAVGLPQEPIPLEPTDVATDRHLGNAELASQLCDMNRLLRGDARQDPMTPIYGVSDA